MDITFLYFFYLLPLSQPSFSFFIIFTSLMSSHFIRNDNVSPTRFDLDLVLDLSHSNLMRVFFFFFPQIENKTENISPTSHMRGGSNDLRLHNNYSWSGMINMLSRPIAIFSSWFYFFRKKIIIIIILNSFKGKRKKKRRVLGIPFLFGNTFLKTPKPPSQ